MPPDSRRAAASLLLALLAACGGKSTPPPPPPPPVVGSGTAWQLFSPSAFVGTTLTVSLPALENGERVAVLFVNAGGDDRALATVGVTGTGAPSLAPVAPPLASLAAGGAAGQAGLADEVFDHAPIRRGEALATALAEETVARLGDGRLRPVARATAAPPVAAALPATRSFCQGRYGAIAATTSNPDGFARFWLPATLALESAHAAFYYVDEVKPGIDAALAARPDFWTSLANAYELKIYPALTTYFGPVSDVDANGKVIFLLGNLGKVGTPPNEAFTVGYFWSGDLSLAAADATSCPAGGYPGSTGNRADLLYLMDPGTFTSLAGGTGANYLPVLDGIITSDYPGVMAHELQHDVNYNARGPYAREETWLNEGLSKLSETVAGYGLHTPSGRSAVRYYLGEVDPKSGTNQVVYHRNYGLTIWEGDPRGNYAAVQAYMQYLIDHASPAMSQALENPALAGKANVAAATGVAWELGFARFVTASMFSNEDTSAYAGGTVASTNSLLGASAYNYLGDGVSPDYVPWHRYTGYCTTGGVRYDKVRLAHVAYTPLTAGGSASVRLRRDGWAAFATGPGSGAAATITVQSAAAVKPYVAVVKYTGALPNFTPLDATCP